MPGPPQDILEIVARQRRQLERLAPSARERLLRPMRVARDHLLERLRLLPADAPAAQVARVALAQVEAVLVDVEREMRRGLETVGRDAAAVGRQGLIDQVRVWSEHYRGSVRRIAPVELASDLMDPGLLEYYESSVERYGMDAIRRARATMARATLEGLPISDVWDQLVGPLEVPRSWAERIVRTEQSLAMHRRQLADLREMFPGEDDQWRKQLVSTFDSRTGEDSRFVHGQVKRLDEPFRDNEGRTYMHPPNRPNDREVMVLVPAEFAGR